MAKRILFCPKCMNRVKKNDLKCSQCGLSRQKMEEMIEAKEKTKAEKEEANFEEKKVESPVQEEDGGLRINTGALIEKEKKGKSVEESIENPEEEKRFEEIEEPEEEVEMKDPEKGISDKDIGKVVFEEKKKRHKHKTKLKEEPKYTVDDNGDFNIDTSDVTFLEGVEAPTYSVKKARGEVTEEKLKWWEIYKWADRMLAKRKIMKEVKKASTKTPYGISRAWMIVLCILFGYIGAHNLYAKNYKRGFTVMSFFAVVILVVSIDVLYNNVGIFIGGGLGFVIVTMWLYDLFMLIINKFRYRISKEEFISNLNVETRAKLGKKYVNFDRTVFKAKEQARVDKINKKRKKKKA